MGQVTITLKSPHSYTIEAHVTNNCRHKFKDGILRRERIGSPMLKGINSHGIELDLGTIDGVSSIVIADTEDCKRAFMKLKKAITKHYNLDQNSIEEWEVEVDDR